MRHTSNALVNSTCCFIRSWYNTFSKFIRKWRTAYPSVQFVVYLMTYFKKFLVMINSLLCRSDTGLLIRVHVTSQVEESCWEKLSLLCCFEQFLINWLTCQNQLELTWAFILKLLLLVTLTQVILCMFYIRTSSNFHFHLFDEINFRFVKFRDC